MSSWSLWLPDLLARKGEVYAPGRFCFYLTGEAKSDRELVRQAWEASRQEPLGGPCRLVIAVHRSPDDRTGDIDHWTPPLLDHLTKAGAWTDDALIWCEETRRLTARTVDETGILLVAWEEEEADDVL